jgi:hypothetical protein
MKAYSCIAVKHLAFPRKLHAGRFYNLSAVVLEELPAPNTEIYLAVVNGFIFNTCRTLKYGNLSEEINYDT